MIIESSLGTLVRPSRVCYGQTRETRVRVYVSNCYFLYVAELHCSAPLQRFLDSMSNCTTYFPIPFISFHYLSEKPDFLENNR
jgi:hypothetical protein